MTVFGNFVLGCGFSLHGTFGQGQFVGRSGGGSAVFNFGLYLASCLATGAASLGGRHSFGELAAEVIEVGGLGDDGSGCIRRRNGCGIIGTGDFQHATGLEAIDIATNKGIRIASEQGHQHLV